MVRRVAAQITPCLSISYDSAPRANRGGGCPRSSRPYPIYCRSWLVGSPHRSEGVLPDDPSTAAVPDLLCASLLAMEINDDAGPLIHRGALRFFASNRASTGCSYRGPVAIGHPWPRGLNVS
ncbi:hypothetical protein EMIT0P218_120010 [Pseudomonas sp. IT-P218]